jgi:tetratricopeptide (TPR) repeat protein
MSNENWPTVQKLFDELIELPEPRWDAALTTHRVPEPTRTRVLALLAAAQRKGPLDKRPVALSGNGQEEGQGVVPGMAVGDFVVDRPIGSGGMGEVFEAHRAGDGFRQRAALKLLRVNALENRAAFTRERQLLAELEHPGIARLIDGGIAADGRPYLAMEFVDGQPIDQWVVAHAASLETRLRLFLDVCATLTFAHAQLIVHRDLKPSNILVDRDGRTRLVDFGVAKLLNDVVPEDGAETTLALMTPDFAAPEQLEGGAISAATDIYAMGGVLYVLLTGHGPWFEEGSSMPSVIRRILAGDPPLPSQAVRADGPIPASAIKGDLDAIVLKALRREPAERYASASELAEDVRRHLALEPVRARAGTRRYRLGRFARRYRWGLAAGAALAATLLAGIVGVTIQARQAAIERDVARAEAERADAVVQMMTLMAADSSGQADMSVKAMLDGAAKRLLSTADTSARSAALVVAMADLYINRQDPKGLYDFLKAALAHGIGSEDPVGTAEMKLRLATVAVSMGNDAEAKQLVEEAEPVFAGTDNRLAIDRTEAVGVRAQLARKAGDYPTAIALLRDDLPEAERAYAGRERELLTRYNNLLVYLIEANELDQFGALMPRVDAAIASTGMQDSIQGLGIRLTEAAWRVRTGEVATAEQMFREIANKRRQLYPGTAGLATDLFQLSRVLVSQRKYAEARATMAEALPIAESTLGPAAIPTLLLQMQMIEVDAEVGETGRAQARFDQLSSRVASLPLPPLPVATLARTEAILRLNQRRPADARAALDRAQAIMVKMGPAGAAFVKGLEPIRKRIG